MGGAGEGRVQDGSAFVVGVVADDADVEVIATACMVRFTWSAAAFILLMPSACPAIFCSMQPDWSMRNRK